MNEIRIPIKRSGHEIEEVVAPIKYVDGEVQVSEQLIYGPRSPQLTFEGLERKPSSFEQLWHNEIYDSLRAHQEEHNTFLSWMAGAPRYHTERLFEPAPQCHAYAGDFDCNLDRDHAGPHYDALERIEWSRR